MLALQAMLLLTLGQHLINISIDTQSLVGQVSTCIHPHFRPTVDQNVDQWLTYVSIMYRSRVNQGY